MAFLCPDGFKKKGGSDGTSIVNAYGVSDISEDGGGLPDQMGNLSLNAQQPDFLEVIEDFTQCSSALELPVRAGEIVTFLGSEGSWVFVRTTNGADGYIPRRSCRVIRNRSDISTHAYHDSSDVGYYSDHQHNERDNGGPSSPFKKSDRHSGGLNTRSISSQDMSDGRYGSDVNTDRYGSDVNTDMSCANETTASIRDLRQNYLEATRHIRSVSDCVETATWHRQDTRQTPSYTAPASAVCGRKCGQRCIHKTNADSIQHVGYPSDIQLKRPISQSENTLAWDEYTSNYPTQHDNYSTNKDNYSTNKIQHRSHSKTDVRCNDFSSDDSYYRGDGTGYYREDKTTGYYRRDDSVHNLQRMKLPPDERSSEDRERMERRLLVNKKVVNHVRSTLDDHKRVQMKVTSYWREADAKMRKSQSKNQLKKCVSTADGLPLCKCGHPELIVIKDYDKAGDTDISVGCGDFATIINDRKYTDWIFVQHESGERGYIPTDCTLRHECEDCGNDDVTDERQVVDDENTEEIPNYEEMKRLIVHESFSRDYPNYLKVSVGEYVYMDPETNTIKERLWVYSSRQRCYGYVPANVVKDLNEVEAITV